MVSTEGDGWLSGGCCSGVGRHRSSLCASGAALLVSCSSDDSGPAEPGLVHQPRQRRPGDAGPAVRGGVRRRLPHRDPDPAQRGRPAARAAGAPPRRRRSVHRPDEPRPAVRRRVRQRRLPPPDHRPGRRRGVHRRACSRRRWRRPSGTTSSSPRRSGPTPSCSGTASRWPRPPASTPPPPTSRGTQMIEAAESQGKRIGVQGRRYEGYMVWINALIASGGGQIIENPELGADATPSMASPAGDKAAEIVGTLGPLVGRAGRHVDRRRGGGPVAVPGRRRVVHGQLALRLQRRQGVRWRTAPRPVGGRRHRLGPLPGGRRRTSRAPRRSAASTSAIGAFTKYPDEALAAAKCITSLREQRRVHDRVGQPGGPGRGLRRPRGAGGVPDGRPDPRLDQRAPGPGRSPRTTATSRCRCSARGTRRTRVQTAGHAGGDRRYMGEVLQGERLL